MRKRFYDLLDDTFSLFGSRKSSPDNKYNTGMRSRQIQSEAKSHSAANSRAADDLKASTPRQRPKTTDLRKADHQMAPKGAWSSKAPSPLIRPLSACVVQPKTPGVNVEHILSEGRFRKDDPAVSLIRTIKSEIERVSLPGSATALRK
nr:unnamed protein product [Callosobruchus analis]